MKETVLSAKTSGTARKRFEVIVEVIKKNPPPKFFFTPCFFYFLGTCSVFAERVTYVTPAVVNIFLGLRPWEIFQPWVQYYQPILHTLYYTLHTEHAYCLSYRFFNNVVITTVIEMVEMVEILDGRLGKHSAERVRYVINNLLHLVIVKYGVISLVLCISTRLRLVTILSLLVMKYLVIFHADPCNKSYLFYTSYSYNNISRYA